jgi:hypothetical protein
MPVPGLHGATGAPTGQRDVVDSQTARMQQHEALRPMGRCKRFDGAIRCHLNASIRKSRLRGSCGEASTPTAKQLAALCEPTQSDAMHDALRLVAEGTVRANVAAAPAATTCPSLVTPANVVCLMHSGNRASCTC